jgi:signal transduction histidine kinase
MARHSLKASTGHTILVVDDQEDTLVATRSLLQREGHHVLTAESGEQGLQVLRTDDVQLIIVDYFMPRMSGAQFVREVRAFDPFVQIILQTGYAGEHPPRVMLAELAIQGYHDKTDDPERLLLWVDVALNAYRLLDRVRQRERLHGELVANCSHEFRTPLNIILGWVELLLGGDLGSLPAPAIPALRSIEESARGLADMVVDFLQYAKLDAGVAEVTRDAVVVEDLGREMERLAAVLLEDKDVVFVLELAGAPPRLVTDGVKLRTILRNLVTNAAKFTAAGTITLRIAVRDGALRIEVRDTGPGIEPEDREIIFEPFRQLDGSSTRAHSGIGLGLALSRKLARTLGGALEVESERGVGSTFTLILPAEPAGVSGRTSEAPLAASA